MDYTQFSERGEEYLKKYMSPQWFELQRLHASPGFKKEQNTAKKLIELGLVERKNVLIEDLEALLSRNLLVGLIDSGKLAGENQSAGHFILIYGQDRTNFYLHDPGLPPRESWVVDKAPFMKSFRDELIMIPW